MTTTTRPFRTATQIKLHNLGIDLADAIDRANRTDRRADHLRVRAIREEMQDVRAGR